MTRSYFSEYVTEWDELLGLCREYGCDICDDIIDDDTLDEYVESDISNSNDSWRAIRDYLADIPTGYDYYRCDGSFDYAGLDNYDNFDDYKARVLEWMDCDDLWDEEEDEDEDEDFDPDEVDFFSPGSEENKPEEPPVEEEDFSVSDLMSMCGSELLTIRQVAERQKKEIDIAMEAMLFAV